MNHYDPLDWIHQWDAYEMMMYAEHEGDAPGIYMQVSQHHQQDGAQTWEVLYDRRLAPLDVSTSDDGGSDAWCERVLRGYLNEHPQLVADEKRFLSDWLARS